MSSIIAEMMQDHVSLGQAANTSVWTVPHSWTYAIWILLACNLLAGLISFVAICVKIKDPERRFLVKKTERAEGTYWVPHSALITLMLIVVSTGLCTAILVYIYMAWAQASTSQLGRTVSTLMPFPEWSWVWFSSFGPAYACHLFPLEAVENATSPRIARALRYKPAVINTFCYTMPILVLIPTIILSSLWPVEFSKASASAKAIADSNLQQWTPAQLKEADNQIQGASRFYQALWGIWLSSFVLASIIYVVYSVLLQRILRMQLTTLNQLDRATKIARKQSDAHELKSGNPSGFNVESILSGMSTNGVHQLSVDFIGSGSGSDESAASTPDGTARPKNKRRRSNLRNTSFFGWTPFTGTSSLDSEMRQYSKLDLLRLNTNIITIEAIVFTTFCAMWSGFSMIKTIQGLALVVKYKTINIILLAQLVIGIGFALLASITIYWRGRNVANTRMEGSPGLQQPKWTNVLNNLNSPKLNFKIEMPALNRFTTGASAMTAVTEKTDDSVPEVEVPLRRGSPKDKHVSDWVPPESWDDNRLTQEQNGRSV